MSREQLLALSRRVSELELEARQMRHGSGITDALVAVQTAIARRLDRIEAAEVETPPPVAPKPDAPAILARFRAHLASAGHGGQARMAVASGLSQSCISKLLRGGKVGAPTLRRLESALDAAEREGRSS